MKRILCMLGAIDPEMVAIRNRLISTGLSHRVATVDGKTVTPGKACSCDPLPPEIATKYDEVVWIECRPTSPSVVKEHFIDHHGPSAPRTHTIMEAYWESSIGQLARFLTGFADSEANSGCGNSAMFYRIAATQFRDPEAIAVGAMDHDLRALGWRFQPIETPWGVCYMGEALMCTYRIMSKCAAELRDFAELDAKWEQELELVERAEVHTFRTRTFSDETSVSLYMYDGAGEFTAEIFTLKSSAYITVPRLRPGEMTKTQLGGAAPAKFVEAWMAAMRLALQTAASTGDPAALAAMQQTPDGTGVYGSPARGFAGVYGMSPEQVISIMDQTTGLFERC